MLANSVAVCAAARAKGCKIMHTPITFAADGADWPAALPIRVHVCGAGAREGVKEKTRQWERGRGAAGQRERARMPQIESIGFLVANDPDKGPGMHMHMRKWNPLCTYSRIWDLICTYMCACMDRIGQSEQGPRYPQGLPRQRLFHPWVLERRLCCRHACMCMYVYAHMHTRTHAHTRTHSCTRTARTHTNTQTRAQGWSRRRATL